MLLDVEVREVDEVSVRARVFRDFVRECVLLHEADVCALRERIAELETIVDAIVGELEPIILEEHCAARR